MSLPISIFTKMFNDSKVRDVYCVANDLKIYRELSKDVEIQNVFKRLDAFRLLGECIFVYSEWFDIRLHYFRPR